jgi:hypothetical protein
LRSIRRQALQDTLARAATAADHYPSNRAPTGLASRHSSDSFSPAARATLMRADSVCLAEEHHRRIGMTIVHTPNAGRHESRANCARTHGTHRGLRPPRSTDGTCARVAIAAAAAALRIEP